MANPNPSPATRFGAANPPPGRAKQKGARDRLSAAFLTALADTFETHGVAALTDLAQNDKATFIRVVASLEQKSLAIEERTPESVLTDEQLEELHEEYAEILARRAAAKAARRATARESANHDQRAPTTCGGLPQSYGRRFRGTRHADDAAGNG